MRDEVEGSVSRVGKSLRSFGVPRSRVHALVEDLRAEVAAAVGSGGSAASIIGDDPRRFAAELASAEGYEPVPSRFVGLSIAAAIPPGVIAFVVYVVVLGGGPTLGLPEMRAQVGRNESNEEFLDAVGEGWFAAGMFAVAALLGFALTLSSAAGYLGWRRDPRVGPTVRNMVLALPVGGAAGVLSAMLVGATTNYSTSLGVIVVECAVAATIALVALWVARRLARGLPVGLGLASH